MYPKVKNVNQFTPKSDGKIVKKQTKVFMKILR